MPALSDAELLMIAEVVSELAKCRGTSFDRVAKGYAFGRAAIISVAFRACPDRRGAHRRLEARRLINLPVKMLPPIAPLFGDLERDAEAVLSGWWPKPATPRGTCSQP